MAEPGAGGADAALDFFAALDEVPLAARAPALRAPAAAGLARALLAALAYPPGFAGWQDCELDEDAFERFRRARLPGNVRAAGARFAGNGGRPDRPARFVLLNSVINYSRCAWSSVPVRLSRQLSDPAGRFREKGTVVNAQAYHRSCRH